MDDLLPPMTTFPVVRAPSLALRVIEFMKTVKFHSETHLKKNGLNVSICVSHQLTKKTPPGTALAIAELLGVPPSAIEDLRTTEAQKAFGVPEEHLERHSYHSVRFGPADCATELTIRINGLREYAEGALIIAVALDKHRAVIKDGGVFTVSYILSLEKKPVPG